MNGILIADAGSTKTDWALISEESEPPLRISGSGINPAFHTFDSIHSKLIELESVLPTDLHISHIYFYGAGCASYELNNKVVEALKSIWGKAEIRVESDLVGAATALFGNGKGIACILGTGSNSCVYENGKIIDRIPSLGFILGDEGSGAYLGKTILNAIFKKRLPINIIEDFHKEYNLSTDEVIRNVYSSPSPSAFLASIVPFIVRNLEKPEIRSITKEGFNKFLEYNVIPYKELNYPLGFVGSVAYYFKTILSEVAEKHNLSISYFLKSPMDGLISHHSKKNNS